MSVAISWANKMQLAKCDIMVGFPISSHIYYYDHFFITNLCLETLSHFPNVNVYPRSPILILMQK